MTPFCNNGLTYITEVEVHKDTTNFDNLSPNDLFF